MKIALHTRVRANTARQARMAELLDPPRDYSAAGGDPGLPVVWLP